MKKLNLQRKLPIYFLLFFTSSITLYLVSINFSTIHDLAYFLTNGLRLSQGQIPYADFITVHSPGSFYIIAALIKIFGINYLPIYLWMFFVNFISTICIYKILKNMKINNYLLATSVFGILGPYSFVPHPWYDSDSVFVIIVLIYMLFFSDKYNQNKIVLFFLGNLSFVPFFIKQNIGIVFLVILNLIILFNKSSIVKYKTYFFAGQFLATLSFLYYLYINAALQKWYLYTFVYAINSRLGSVIPEIFPIRFLKHEGFLFKYEDIYYVLYLIFLALCGLYILKNLKSVKSKFYITELTITIFTIFLLIDDLVFNEVVIFLSMYPSLIQLAESKNLVIVLFIIFSILNLITSRLNPRIELLEKLFFSIYSFVTVSLSVMYISKLMGQKNTQGFAQISFEYNLLFMFFMFFPFVLLALSVSFNKKNKNYLFIIPMLGYLYGTSLSMGVASSIAGGTGLLIVIFLIVTTNFQNIQIIKYTNFTTYLLSFMLFLTAIFGGKYHFIKFEDDTSFFSELKILSLPSSHYDQQIYAKDIIEKYNETHSKIIFVPEATTAYFSTNYFLESDVHTFDHVTNPYAFKNDRYSIKEFLECNNVDLVVVNTNNHRRYFDRYVSSDNLFNYLGPNYIFIEKYTDFLIYERLVQETFSLDICDL